MGNVLLLNGSLITVTGDLPKVGTIIHAVIKNSDGSFEQITAEILETWEVNCDNY